MDYGHRHYVVWYEPLWMAVYGSTVWRFDAAATLSHDKAADPFQRWGVFGYVPVCLRLYAYHPDPHGDH